MRSVYLLGTMGVNAVLFGFLVQCTPDIVAKFIVAIRI